MAAEINIPRERIAEFCRRHRVRKLMLFGSILRGDFGPDSDVDVLMEFKPGCTPGLGIVDVEEELSRILGGRRADIVNPKYLNRRIRDHVLATAEAIYEEG
ncbi:MAG: nucleotidyltransferase domain-containing protein [bacterium]